MNLVISSFQTMQEATNQKMNLPQLETARIALRDSEIAFQQMERNIDEANQQQRRFNRTVQEGHSLADTLTERIKGFVDAYLGFQGINKAVNFVRDTIAAYNVQNEAEIKLETVMRKRMGATDEMVQSIKDLASAQQKLGVIGDEVQLAGAQQLSTFLNTSEALETLMPAMNHLAVQQNGVNVTSQDLVGLGNLVGKAMQGQTGALTRVGITFNEAQEKALKYGNEIERSAILAEIITDNVGAMNEVMAKTPQGIIAQMKNDWGDVFEVVGGKLYPAVLKFLQVLYSHMPMAAAAMEHLAVAIGVVIQVISPVVDIIGKMADVIVGNWSVIQPIILGVAAAIGGYCTIALAAKGVTIALFLAHKVAAAATSFHTAMTSTWSIAAFKATVAQSGLNAALLSCPITWIVVGIIAIIAIIYAAVAAFNKFTSSTVSATGIIIGAIFVLGAHIANNFIFLQNVIADFVNFFANAFHDPISAIKILFYDLAATVLKYVGNMAEGIENVINKIPGVQVDITSGLDNFQRRIEDMATKAKTESEWKEYVKKWDVIDYGDAYKKGAEIGKGLEDKVKNAFKFDIEQPNIEGLTASVPGIDSIAKDTGKIADSVEISEDYFELMRDLAEREAINKFTTVPIYLDARSTNNVSSEIDLDGMVTYLSGQLWEGLHTAAEGAHY